MVPMNTPAHHGHGISQQAEQMQQSVHIDRILNKLGWSFLKNGCHQRNGWKKAERKNIEMKNVENKNVKNENNTNVDR
jgi:hypothetical protein